MCANIVVRNSEVMNYFALHSEPKQNIVYTKALKPTNMGGVHPDHLHDVLRTVATNMGGVHPDHLHDVLQYRGKTWEEFIQTIWMMSSVPWQQTWEEFIQTICMMSSVPWQNMGGVHPDHQHDVLYASLQPPPTIGNPSASS